MSGRQTSAANLKPFVVLPVPREQNLSCLDLPHLDHFSPTGVSSRELLLPCGCFLQCVCSEGGSSLSTLLSFLSPQSPSSCLHILSARLALLRLSETSAPPTKLPPRPIPPSLHGSSPAHRGCYLSVSLLPLFLKNYLTVAYWLTFHAGLCPTPSGHCHLLRNHQSHHLTHSGQRGRGIGLLIT